MDLATNRRGHNGPSWTPSSHTIAITSAAIFITLDGRYDGSSQEQRSVEGLRSEALELLEYGYGTTSLNLQDGPSWIQRFSTLFVTPHLVRLPHLSSAAALRCPLQTVTRKTDRHSLRRWSLLHFFAQNLRIHLWTDFLQK